MFFYLLLDCPCWLPSQLPTCGKTVGEPSDITNWLLVFNCNNEDLKLLCVDFTVLTDGRCLEPCLAGKGAGYGREGGAKFDSKSIVGALSLDWSTDLVLWMLARPRATCSVQPVSYSASIKRFFHLLFTAQVPAADWFWGLHLLSDLRLRHIFPAGSSLHIAAWITLNEGTVCSCYYFNIICLAKATSTLSCKQHWTRWSFCIISINLLSI